MGDRKQERKYRYYICGRCKTRIEYKINEEPPIPCPDCGYAHFTRDYRQIPQDLKIDIN